MERRLPHRKHEDIERIIEEAKNGNAFFVNRAAENGDLAVLPEDQQRRIIAMANDEAARYAQDQIIPLTDNAHANNQSFIEKHLNLAINIFVKKDKRPIAKQISEFYES